MDILNIALSIFAYGSLIAIVVCFICSFLPAR